MIKELYNKIINSFDNENSGFSARKLSSFAAVVTAIVFTFKFGTTEHIDIILLIWLAFALLCLGIITMQQIVNFKNGNNTNESK